jgi:hypothetical protein
MKGIDLQIWMHLEEKQGHFFSWHLWYLIPLSYINDKQEGV